MPRVRLTRPLHRFGLHPPLHPEAPIAAAAPEEAYEQGKKHNVPQSGRILLLRFFRTSKNIAKYFVKSSRLVAQFLRDWVGGCTLYIWTFQVRRFAMNTCSSLTRQNSLCQIQRKAVCVKSSESMQPCERTAMWRCEKKRSSWWAQDYAGHISPYRVSALRTAFCQSYAGARDWRCCRKASKEMVHSIRR